jgi:hypothetical protein
MYFVQTQPRTQMKSNSKNLEGQAKFGGKKQL